MKKLLFFAVFLLLAVVLKAQPTRNIPATVLPLLDKAEFLRANFLQDSSVVLLQQAQNEYMRLGMEYEQLCLYPKIFILAGEIDLTDSLTYYQRLNDFNQKRLRLYPNDKWLEARYYLSEAFLYHSLSNLPKENVATTVLKKNKFYNDWEIEFFYRLLISFNKKYDFSKEDDNEIKNYQLLLKNAPLNSLKTAYLYYSYPAYLWYGIDNLADYYLFIKDYEKAIGVAYQTLTYLEQAPYLDSVFYSTTMHSLARIYTVKSDFSKAIEFEHKAIAYSPPHKTHPFMYYNRNLSYYYQLEENYKTAIKHSKLALQFCNQYEGGYELKMDILASLVKNYTLLNRFTDAQPYVDSISANQNLPTPYDVFAELGYFYQQQKNYTAANQY